MRQRIVLCVLGALVAGPGLGAPSVQIRGAAVRVVVIPEARSDIAVTVIRASSKLPLKVRTAGGQVFVNGDVRHRVHGCLGAGRGRSVEIWGRGQIAYSDLPQLLIRTPLDARISAG